MPLLVIVQLMFTMGVSLILSMANVIFRDVKYLVEALVPVWMFATSVESDWLTATTLIGVEVGAPPLVIATT